MRFFQNAPEESPKEEVDASSTGEIINDSHSFLDNINNIILPNALMIGVDYDLFWRLNPKSLTPFIKAFTMKIEHEDMMAWKQGLYIQQAIVACFGKNTKYPKKPFSDLEKEKKYRSDPINIKKMVEFRSEVINTRFEKEVEL